MALVVSRRGVALGVALGVLFGLLIPLFAAKPTFSTNISRLPLQGRLPSFAADESGHSAAYSLNVGNLRDTGHSDGATPPTAMAEQQSFKFDPATVSSWSNRDDRFIGRLSIGMGVGFEIGRIGWIYPNTHLLIY